MKRAASAEAVGGPRKLSALAAAFQKAGSPGAAAAQMIELRLAARQQNACHAAQQQDISSTLAAMRAAAEQRAAVLGVASGPQPLHCVTMCMLVKLWCIPCIAHCARVNVGASGCTSTYRIVCVCVLVSDSCVTEVLLGVVGVHVYACLCLFVWTVQLGCVHVHACQSVCALVHVCPMGVCTCVCVCVCRRRMCAWCGSVRPHMPVIDTLFVDCLLFSLALCLRSLHFLSICC